MTSLRSKMRVAFRTDAAIEIGTGHVMRCLTLATALRERGATCVFLCRPHEGHLINFITGEGFQVFALPHHTKAALAASDPPHAAWLGVGWLEDARDSLAMLAEQPGGPADWLVVDHYALDARWESMLRPACDRLMVIDDLADRKHDCDLLLDNSLGREPRDYAGLLPQETTTLLGPKYALLRPEFSRLRTTSLARRAKPRLDHVLVTMGGVDKDNATAQVLDALDGSVLPDGAKITVVMGPHAPWLEEIRARAVAMHHPTEVLVEVRDMARLMADSDLAIGAGGTTTWERCALGLPAFTVVVAENQKAIANTLEEIGAAIAVTDVTDLAPALLNFFGREDLKASLLRMSETGARITDGNGAARVVEGLLLSDV